MKKALLLLLVACALMSAKDKAIKVNPAFMGKYYANDTAKAPMWTLKASQTDEGKVEFYQAGEIVPTFVVTMKDSTHFKTAHEFSHTANQVTKMWTAKGEFQNNNQMELVIHISDVTSGLKISFSFDEDQKIIYTKR